MFSFVPPGCRLIPIPGSASIHGQAPQRVCARVKGDKWVISNRPYEVSENSREADNLLRMVMKGDLLPADETTAKAAGVLYRPVTFISAEEGWSVVKATETPAPTPKSSFDGRKAKENL